MVFQIQYVSDSQGHDEVNLRYAEGNRRYSEGNQGYSEKDYKIDVVIETSIPSKGLKLSTKVREVLYNYLKELYPDKEVSPCNCSGS